MRALHLCVVLCWVGTSGCASPKPATPVNMPKAEAETYAPSQGELNSELIIAVKARDVSKVQWLVERGADVNAADTYGFTPLVNAMAHYNQDVIDYLVGKGAMASLDLKSIGEGATNKQKEVAPEKKAVNDALFNAIDESALAAVKQAVTDGADVNALDDHGFTVLVNAIAAKNREVMEYLVGQGAVIHLDELEEQ